MQKTKSFPVFTRAKLVSVVKQKDSTACTHGYAVGIVRRGDEEHPVLFPYEEFPKEKISKFINRDLNLKPTERGLRTSLRIQDIEDLKETNELIAVNMVQMEDRLNEKFNQVEQWLIAIDSDLNKFREIFKVWNSYDQHSIPTD